MSTLHSEVVFVNELNFDEEVLGSELPVLVDVSARWCAPCKLAAPIVKELARTHAGRLKVVEIDGDESPHLAARLRVGGFPTFVGFRGGRESVRQAGFAGRGALHAMAAGLTAVS